MWAWHRIDTLLKNADRNGNRAPVIPEVVRLGEDFSIATEYTSFLVLENDAEYQRWKISRKNVATTGRDRDAQARRREQLDSIRNKALADIGPQAAAPTGRQSPVQMAAAQRPVVQQAQPFQQTSTSDAASRRRRHQSQATAKAGILSCRTDPAPSGQSACWRRCGSHAANKKLRRPTPGSAGRAQPVPHFIPKLSAPSP